MTDFAEGERLKEIWTARRDVWLSDWFYEQRLWIIGTTVVSYAIAWMISPPSGNLSGSPWWEIVIFLAAISWALTWTCMYPISVLISRSNRKWLRAHGEDPDMSYEEFVASLPEDVKSNPPRMDST